MRYYPHHFPSHHLHFSAAVSPNLILSPFSRRFRLHGTFLSSISAFVIMNGYNITISFNDGTNSAQTRVFDGNITQRISVNLCLSSDQRMFVIINLQGPNSYILSFIIIITNSIYSQYLGTFQHLRCWKIIKIFHSGRLH